MKNFGLILCACALAIWVDPAGADTGGIHSPGTGNPERKAILDGLRGWVKKTHNIEATFVVKSIKVKDAWAWVVVNPQSKDGKNRYEPISAALRRGGSGAWTVQLADPRVEWMVADNLSEAAARGKLLKMLSRSYPDLPVGIVPD